MSANGDPVSHGAALNPVILFLGVAALAGVALLGFVGFAPNRIAAVSSLPIWQAASPTFLIATGLGIVLLGGGGFLGGRAGHSAALAGSVILFLSAMAGAGESAGRLVAEAASPAARVSLGGAFWALFAAALLAVAECLQRLKFPSALQIVFSLAVFAVLVVLARMGWFDDLSLVREWANRKEEYAAALGEHVGLVLAALALAVVIGVPLGISALTSAARSGRIFAVLSLIQTIPSIALFGLLIGPLTALSFAVPGLREIGVRGIGFTPALIALTLYGLLPIARNVEVGIRSVPADAVEAARGMGMTRLQITRMIAIPLALPTLLAGLRIVTVQMIGLTVVAALIGAGGFGRFVFIGLGQTATDLVLLGALSTIVLAVLADGALRLVSLAIRPASR